MHRLLSALAITSCLPAFATAGCAAARQNGIDYSKIGIPQLSPSQQETMFLQGQVDTVAVFTATGYMNLVSLKLDPD